MPDSEPPADLDGYDSADLLELAACYDGTDPTCRAAFKVFYDRHAPRLRRNVGGLGNLLGGAREINDLVEETFGVAYRKAHTFRKKADDSPTEVERNVAAWLHRIARNLALDHDRDETRTVEYDETDLLPDVAAAVLGMSDTETPTTPEAKLIQRCLENLPEMQRDALRLIYNYVDPAAGITRLPNGVPARIAKALGTTKVNLRKLRSRAESALRACCDGTTSP